MTPLAILILLFIAHLLGDFIFQPSAWVKDRAQNHFRSAQLYWHALIHGLLAFLAVQDLRQWLIPVVITVSHLMIDLMKSYQRKNETSRLLADNFINILFSLTYLLRRP